MGQGNLSGPRMEAATDEGSGRGRVVRIAKRPHAPLPRLQRTAGNRAQGRHIHGFGVGHRRQDAGKPLREHALSRPWGSYQQQTVLTGGGNFQGAPCMRLAAHVA